MALTVTLVLCLLLVSSSASVMGREILETPYINHWLRNFATPDASACTAFGEKVADPENCHNYYYCLAAGHVFSEVQTCDAEFDCFDPKEAIADAACITDASVCETICASTSQCSLSCTGTSGFAVQQDDCTKYTQCFETPAIEVGRTCPVDKPYFNGQECGTDKTACCTCKLATCTSLGDLIPDPENCHQFYMCDSSLNPQGPLSCPNGGSFINGACDDTTTCTDPCPAGSDLSSTSTSTITTTISSASTTTPSTTTPSTTTTSLGCIDLSDFICPAEGYYAHCSYCDPSYFKCDRAGSTPTLGNCPGDLVFNPNPEYRQCMRPENCHFDK